MNRIFSCALLSRASWTTLHKVFTCSVSRLCCNVGPWLTDNFYEENNLYNVVSTILGQHCLHRNIVSSQCCPTSETKLHKKITCPVLAQSAQTCFCRKITYRLEICLCQHCTRKLFLCNVDPLPAINNFAQKNNLHAIYMG